MRLSKPVYESLPYAYMGLGAGALVFSFYLRSSGWSDAIVAIGLLALVGGLVLVLKRRDYRLQKRRYGAALDEED
jgi:predicted MFS family arabinose efflux permease